MENSIKNPHSIATNVPCATYLDRQLYKTIKQWCDTHEIDFSAFMRVATYHFYFSLSAKGFKPSDPFVAWLGQRYLSKQGGC